VRPHRAPLFVLRWLAVAFGVVAWLVVVPLAELVRALLGRLRPRPPAGRFEDEIVVKRNGPNHYR
jgi:hypothetical protein